MEYAMSSEALTANVILMNDKLGFTGIAGDFPPITLDYIPPLGDGKGYMPLQLMLISLAACSAASLVTLLRRMGKTIRGCTIQASGIRRETHPTGFASISLDFIIDAMDTSEAEIDKAMKLTEETYCPVWAMLKGNVEISTQVVLRGNRPAN